MPSDDPAPATRVITDPRRRADRRSAVGALLPGRADPFGRLGPAGDLHFAQDVRHVVAHRLRAEVKS